MSDWSVLFGGIVGVVLTLFVTWVRDVWERRAERKSKLKWLLAEIIDNLKQIDHHTLAGGRAKVKLLTQAWETTKGDTLDLKPELTRSLQAGYAEVWRFNCIVDYDIQIPTGHSFLSGTLEVKAGEVKTALSDSQSKLASHLGVGTPSSS